MSGETGPSGPILQQSCSTKWAQWDACDFGISSARLVDSRLLAVAYRSKIELEGTKKSRLHAYFPC